LSVTICALPAVGLQEKWTGIKNKKQPAAALKTLKIKVTKFKVLKNRL
jgi:hypothetical protein